MRTPGIVTWFSEPKGYGYLEAEDGTPVFVHHADIRGEGFRTLRPGWGVTFVMDDDGRGPTARDVALQARGE